MNDENSVFAESTREQLARISGSRMFARAPSLSRFLSYLVEQRLGGNASPITEYSLGVDVFDRGDAFDPTTDTIVRVQARRLRSKLEEYYRSEGQHDPMVFEVPRGQYAVVAYAAGECGKSTTPTDAGKELLHVGSGLPPPPPLPTACTSFVGREKELEDVERLLSSERLRLLTLTGAGGSGKTRLALQVVPRIGASFPGGIYVISLASATDAETVASTVAQVVGLRHTGGSHMSEALPMYLAFAVRRPTLLLLDNFEQVTEAAPLLIAILAKCPELKILVTSRALLDVSGEHDYPVQPLAKPDFKLGLTVEELGRNPAVSLFVQRANAVDPGFMLNDTNSGAVAEICARLDGLPLAIELAAARIRVLSPAAMVGWLDKTLDLLTSGYRDSPPRQHTLRRTIDWSHGLLSEPEQVLFRRLAVFVGGCTLESIEAVCNARRDLDIAVLEGVASLVSKNLMYRGEDQAHDVRFNMLQTIREYAMEKLVSSGEADFTRRAQAAYCLVLAEEGAAQHREEDRASWLELWDDEHENLRQALDWLIATGKGSWAIRLGSSLFAFWQRRDHLAEGRERLEAILKMETVASPTLERARLAWYAAIFADQQGDFTNALRLHGESLRTFAELRDAKGVAAQLGFIGQELHQMGKPEEARGYFERSVAACRELGDDAAVATAISNFAEFLIGQEEYTSARALLEEALDLFGDLGNEGAAGWSLNHLGDIAFRERDFGAARRLYSAALEIFRKLTDRWGIGRSLTDLGSLASEDNDQQGARSLLEQALKEFLGSRHTRGVAKVLEELACVAVQQRDFDRALTLAAVAQGLRQRVGAPQRPAERVNLARRLQPAWNETDVSTAGAVWEDGLRMPMDEAIRYALGQILRPPAPAPHS